MSNAKFPYHHFCLCTLRFSVRGSLLPERRTYPLVRIRLSVRLAPSQICTKGYAICMRSSIIHVRNYPLLAQLLQSRDGNDSLGMELPSTWRSPSHTRCEALFARVCIYSRITNYLTLLLAHNTIATMIGLPTLSKSNLSCILSIIAKYTFPAM